MAFVGGKYLNEDELKAYCEQEALKRDNNRHNSTTKNRHWRRLVAAIRKEVVKQEVRHVLASNDGTDIPLESGVHWKLVKIDLPPKPNYGPLRCVNKAKQPLIQQSNDDNEVRLESATKKQRTEKGVDVAQRALCHYIARTLKHTHKHTFVTRTINCLYYI